MPMDSSDIDNRMKSKSKSYVARLAFLDRLRITTPPLIVMIFTYMWAFDQQADWDYIEYVKSIFEPYNTEFYYVELVAPREIRSAGRRSTGSIKLINLPPKNILY